MKLLILEVFDRKNLSIANPWYLFDKLESNFCNYLFKFTNYIFEIDKLILIRKKMVK